MQLRLCLSQLLLGLSFAVCILLLCIQQFFICLLPDLFQANFFSLIRQNLQPSLVLRDQIAVFFSKAIQRFGTLYTHIDIGIHIRGKVLLPDIRGIIERAIALIRRP